MPDSFKLPPHKLIKASDKPFLVIVLDGFGEDQEDEFNAVYRAEMPCLNSLKKNAPDRYMLVKAHGTAVGLPSDADMGNSEVSRCASHALVITTLQMPCTACF